MGTDVSVIVVGGPAGLPECARQRVAQLEQLWSRFRPDSEISRLNANRGVAMRVSPETSELVERAIEGWHLSGGAFDPTLLGAVVDAGYDRPFAELLVRPAGDPAAGDHRPMRPPLPGCESIEVCGELVKLGEGVGFDPGGIGKGLGADVIVTELMEAGAEGACVNLGGDLRVAGTGRDAEGWTVAIRHPLSPEPLALVGIGEGAVATSTTLQRRWAAGNGWRHHLIDPRSGQPSDSDLNFVSVIAAEACVAEVLAKAVLINGSEHAFGILGGTGAVGLSVDAHGTVQMSEGYLAYLGENALPPRQLIAC
jgi:thiamine biosynthesis lipoprotein